MVRKQSARLNITFLDYDKEDMLKQRHHNAQNRRKVAMNLLAEERIILNELLEEY